MAEYTGVVQKHISKAWGEKTFYSFTLSGIDGFFGTGPRKPPAEGSSVVFSAKPNAKGFLEVDTKTLQYRQDGVPSMATIPAGHSGNGVESLAQIKAKGRSPEEKGFWERKELREVSNDAARELGASRNTAIELISLMLKNEAFKLPAQNKKEEFIWALLDHYTKKLMGKDQKPEQGEPATVDPTEVDKDWE